tara:strand:- start:18518 stop:18667 length:150 start_codon:yes stop_codon:yes gene_type:complete
MNTKQKRLRLKRLNAQKKLYKKTGFHSHLEAGYAQVREGRNKEYLAEIF